MTERAVTPIVSKGSPHGMPRSRLAWHVGAGLCACPDAGNHVGADLRVCPTNLCLGMTGRRMPR